MKQIKQRKGRNHYQQFLRNKNLNMYKLILFSLSLLGIQQMAFSQNVDRQILQLLYNNIKKQNEYSLIMEKLNGIYVLADPISGEEEIIYSENIDKKAKDDFKRFNKEEQIKIINSSTYPILLRDTLVIVDTLKIFSVGDVILNQQQSVISIVRKYRFDYWPQ